MFRPFAALRPACLASLWLALPTGAQEAVRFVPQFIPGKVYFYRNETAVTLQLPAPDGGVAAQSVTLGHEVRIAATARAAGSGAKLEASTQRLQFKIASPDREMRYDSADESTKGSALGQHFESARSRTVALEIDDTPKVLSATESGGSPAAPSLPGMPQFGPDELKQLVAGLLQGFPAEAVKPGDQWTQKGRRSLGQFGEMDFEIAYRYKGDEAFQGADCAVIEFAGDMKGGVAVSGAQSGSDGGKLGFEGRNLQGRLVFDKLRRAVRESTQTVSLTVEVPGPNPDAPGGKMKLPMRQQITVTLISLQDA